MVILVDMALLLRWDLPTIIMTSTRDNTPLLSAFLLVFSRQFPCSSRCEEDLSIFALTSNLLYFPLSTSPYLMVSKYFFSSNLFFKIIIYFSEIFNSFNMLILQIKKITKNILIFFFNFIYWIFLLSNLMR